MDTRTDFQRLLEDMDRALRRKKQELIELDERLEAAREQLSEKEAKEMLFHQESTNSATSTLNEDRLKQQKDFEELIQEQRSYYERKLSELTEELVELETSNKDLVKTNDQFQFDVDSLRVSNEKLRTEIQTLNESLEEVQSANFELNIRLAKAESQSQMQQRLLKKSHDQDQILMDAFNSKLESLKEALASRDEEIKRLRSDNQITLESLGIRINSKSSSELTDDNNDKSSKGHLTNDASNDFLSKQKFIAKLIREKDTQISDLSEQLVQATRELENNARLIETITNEKVENQSSVHLENTKLSTNENELETKCKMLEVELNEKDKQLHWMNRRIRHFENILPSKIVDLIEELLAKCRSNGRTLNDARQVQATSESFQNKKDIFSLISRLCESLNKLLDELSSSQLLLNTIDQLKRVVLSRDEQIRRLVNELNEMNARINHDQIGATSTVEDAGGIFTLPQSITDEQQDTSNSLNQKANNYPSIQENNNEEREEVDEQEATANISPTQETVISDSQSSRAHAEHDEGEAIAASVEKNDDKLDSIGNILDKSNSLENRNESIKDFSTDELSKSHPTQELNIETSNFCDSDNIKVEQVSVLKDRLSQLIDENQLLELAMKEILLSIKWSDTRCSTILIDCPSLERLCQLIEARYIANSNQRNPSSIDRVDNLKDLLSGDKPNMTNFDCDLFQLVVMKSELDILRGQNEQLRSDLKLQRRDWRDSIPMQQEHFVDTTSRNRDRTDHNEKTCEIECQTDSLILLDLKHLELKQQIHAADSFEDKLLEKKQKCKNCFRLVRLANHLLDCIVRIETRVNSSDESYITRLLALNQLIQRLSKDLSLKDRLISQLRKDHHLVSQQKMFVEARLNSIEGHLEVHSKMCPMSYPGQTLNHHRRMSATNTHFVKPTDISLPNKTRSNNFESVTSLTIRNNQEQVEVPLRDNRITISLLQSIISCLQARLDYKDERLNQMEHMLVAI